MSGEGKAANAGGARLVPCPTCKTLVPYAPSNRWRPFCSERCRNIDLGAWASESYSVPVQDRGEDDAPAADDREV